MSKKYVILDIDIRETDRLEYINCDIDSKAKEPLYFRDSFESGHSDSMASHERILLNEYRFSEKGKIVDEIFIGFSEKANVKFKHIFDFFKRSDRFKVDERELNRLSQQNYQLRFILSKFSYASFWERLKFLFLKRI